MQAYSKQTTMCAECGYAGPSDRTGHMECRRCGLCAVCCARVTCKADPSHAGEFRTGMSNRCKLSEDNDGTLFCVHGGGTIQGDHWSCCGKKSRFRPCPNASLPAVQHQQGARLCMKCPDTEADWAGCPGARLGFQRGSLYTAAEIRSDFFRTEEFPMLWAPLKAAAAAATAAATAAAAAAAGAEEKKAEKGKKRGKRKAKKLRKGCKVKISADVEAVRLSAAGHGGWNPHMAQYCGLKGKVMKVDSDGDVRVRFSDGNGFFFNAAVVQRVEAEPTPEAAVQGGTAERDLLAEHERLLRLPLGQQTAAARQTDAARLSAAIEEERRMQDALEGDVAEKQRLEALLRDLQTRTQLRGERLRNHRTQRRMRQFAQHQVTLAALAVRLGCDVGDLTAAEGGTARGGSKPFDGSAERLLALQRTVLEWEMVLTWAGEDPGQLVLSDAAPAPPPSDGEKTPDDADAAAMACPVASPVPAPAPAPAPAVPPPLTADLAAMVAAGLLTEAQARAMMPVPPPAAPVADATAPAPLAVKVLPKVTMEVDPPPPPPIESVAILDSVERRKNWLPPDARSVERQRVQLAQEGFLGQPLLLFDLLLRSGTMLRSLGRLSTVCRFFGSRRREPLWGQRPWLSLCEAGLRAIACRFDADGCAAVQGTPLYDSGGPAAEAALQTCRDGQVRRTLQQCPQQSIQLLPRHGWARNVAFECQNLHDAPILVTAVTGEYYDADETGGAEGGAAAAADVEVWMRAGAATHDMGKSRDGWKRVARGHFASPHEGGAAAFGDGELCEGCQVFSQFRKVGGKKYPGSITAVNADGSFEVLYQDGDRDSNVPVERLSPPHTAKPVVLQPPVVIRARQSVSFCVTSRRRFCNGRSVPVAASNPDMKVLGRGWNGKEEQFEHAFKSNHTLTGTVQYRVAESKAANPPAAAEGAVGGTTFESAVVGQTVYHKGREAELLGFRCPERGLVGDTSHGCANDDNACRLRYADDGQNYNVYSRELQFVAKPGELGGQALAPAVGVSHHHLPVGMRVVRGPHWEWGDQDGGPGGQGVIVEHEDDQWTVVQWDGGHRGCYKNGLRGVVDLQAADGAPPPAADGAGPPLTADLAAMVAAGLLTEAQARAMMPEPAAEAPAAEAAAADAAAEAASGPWTCERCGEAGQPPSVITCSVCAKPRAVAPAAGEADEGEPTDAAAQIATDGGEVDGVEVAGDGTQDPELLAIGGADVDTKGADTKKQLAAKQVDETSGDETSAGSDEDGSDMDDELLAAMQMSLLENA